MKAYSIFEDREELKQLYEALPEEAKTLYQRILNRDVLSQQDWQPMLDAGLAKDTGYGFMFVGVGSAIRHWLEIKHMWGE